MKIDDVNRGIKKNKARRRLGRGIGSGQGKTAGRGHKGQQSRSNWSSSATFEGGQMPLVRRIPKRGFTNRFARTTVSVNVGQIDELFQAGEEVNPAALAEKRLVKGAYDRLKILGDGELSKALNFSAHAFSATALEKIQQAGGKATVLPGPKPVVKNKKEKKAKA